jgi:hypothetical protein
MVRVLIDAEIDQHQKQEIENKSESAAPRGNHLKNVRKDGFL